MFDLYNTPTPRIGGVSKTLAAFGRASLTAKANGEPFDLYAHTPNRTGMPVRAAGSSRVQYHYAMWAYVL